MHASNRAVPAQAAPAADPRPRSTGFGMLLASLMLALADGRPSNAAAEIARKRFPYAKQLNQIITRANEVAGGNTGGWGSELATDDPVTQFLGAVQYREVLGRLPAVQTVPPNVRMSALSSEALGYVIAEGVAAKLSAPAFSAAVSVNPLKVVALFAFTNDLLRRGQTVGQAVGYAALRAVVKATDAALLSTASYGLLSGITPIAAGGASPVDIDFDLAELLASLMGADYETTALVTTPAVAVGLSLIRHETGEAAYPLVTARGGTLAGLPLLTSAGCPAGHLVAIDGSALVKGGDAILPEVSRSASLEMSSAPVGNVTNSTGQTQNPVSMFTTDSTAAKLVRTIGWKLRRANAVGYITGLDPLAGISTD